MMKATPINKKAAAMRIKPGLLPEPSPEESGDTSVTMTAGASLAGAASVGVSAGACACVTSVTTGGSTAVARSNTLEAVGKDAAMTVGVGEFFAPDERVGVAADAAGPAELPAAVGRGVIVAPVAKTGVATLPLSDGVVESVDVVSGCIVGVAVGVRVTVDVAVGVGVAVAVGVLVAETPAVAEIGP